jgi:hypothetical protein
MTTEQQIAVLQLVEDALRAYRVGLVEPDPIPDPPLLVLQPSGSITVTADNQVVENKLVTGDILIQNRRGVIIRNCQINHFGGAGLIAQSCVDLTIQDCKFVNTSAPIGQKPNAGEFKNIELQNLTGTTTINRVYVEGACGIYAYKCGPLKISFLEGHNCRGPLSVPRGQLIQLNQCTGGMTLEDFSCENDPNNSWSADNVSVYQSSGAIFIRRGLLDGNNDPSGCAVMLENGTHGVLVEDVDCIRQGNGAFAVYNASNNNIYRRCRVRDTIQQSQGRGPALSNYCTYVSSPDCSGTRFEQNKYFNVNEGNLFWLASTMTARDCVKEDFTPRAPIRNKFAWVA